MTTQPPPDPYGAPPPSGPPHYHPPPHYYPYPYPPPRATNVLAILALVFAFVFAPAAIVLGHLARKQIRQTGEDGDGLALAGMIVGYVFTGIAVLFCVGYAAFFVSFLGAFGAASSDGWQVVTANLPHTGAWAR